jgi:hypothetical protein
LTQSIVIVDDRDVVRQPIIGQPGVKELNTLTLRVRHTLLSRDVPEDYLDAGFLSHRNHLLYVSLPLVPHDT